VTLFRQLASFASILLVTACYGAAVGARPQLPRAQPPPPMEITGKLNLNTATEEQLMLLPTVGPLEAERIVTWRKKNGGFKRTADLRRVKGFGYKTFKRLEPFLDIKGDSTLAASPSQPGTH
jgi:competence ComEA-like helix-hairpin-helix protein